MSKHEIIVMLLRRSFGICCAEMRNVLDVLQEVYFDVENNDDNTVLNNLMTGYYGFIDEIGFYVDDYDTEGEAEPFGELCHSSRFSKGTLNKIKKDNEQ